MTRSEAFDVLKNYVEEDKKKTDQLKNLDLTRISHFLNNIDYKNMTKNELLQAFEDFVTWVM